MDRFHSVKTLVALTEFMRRDQPNRPMLTLGEFQHVTETFADNASDHEHLYEIYQQVHEYLNK